MNLEKFLETTNKEMSPTFNKILVASNASATARLAVPMLLSTSSKNKNFGTDVVLSALVFTRRPISNTVENAGSLSAAFLRSRSETGGR